jgi:hypothetical protein
MLSLINASNLVLAKAGQDLGLLRRDPGKDPEMPEPIKDRIRAA